MNPNPGTKRLFLNFWLKNNFVSVWKINANASND